jgi:predicted O-linked N-acetylglucosamine transferase (SPINDLY family)
MDKLDKAIYYLNNNKLNEAQRLLNEILKKNSADFNALQIIAIVYAKKNEFKTAIEFFNKALKINPNSASTYHNRGNTFREMGEFDQAIIDVQKALSIKEESSFYNTLGCIYFEINNIEDAKINFNISIKLNDKNFEALTNLGKLFFQNQDFASAESLFLKSLLLNKNDPKIYNDIGVIHLVKKEFKKADNILNIGIDLFPNDFLINLTLGNLYSTENFEKFNFEKAYNFYQKAISIKKNDPLTYLNLGLLFKIIGDHKNAIINFKKTVHLQTTDRSKNFFVKKINNPVIELIDSKLKMFDWNELNEDLIDINLNYKKNLNFNPFMSLYIIDSALAQKNIAEYYQKENTFSLQYFNKKHNLLIRNKINIGYFSGDFGNHAVTHLIFGLLRNHNKNKFNINIFSLKKKEDEFTKEIFQLVKNFNDVSNLSDNEIINLAKKMEIHIAVDLSGFTKYCRPNLFKSRMAPIQVSYLGYPGTTGMNEIDYLIADKTLIGPQDQIYYTEKIAYVKDSYQINDDQKKLSEYKFSKKQLNIPEDHFVFNSFNQIHKIQPNIFQCWMRILKTIKRSVLWLLTDDKEIIERIKKSAEQQGVDPNRIIFANQMKHLDHLARIQIADLLLDTFPYGSHTTASDALTMGVPVVTIYGDTFASRVASSLLKAANLPELITFNIKEYEDLIIKIANDATLLKKYKNKLKNKSLLPLFNSKKTTIEIERLFEIMIENFNSNKLNQNIYL